MDVPAELVPLRRDDCWPIVAASEAGSWEQFSWENGHAKRHDLTDDFSNAPSPRRHSIATLAGMVATKETQYIGYEGYIAREAAFTDIESGSDRVLDSNPHLRADMSRLAKRWRALWPSIFQEQHDRVEMGLHSMPGRFVVAMAQDHIGYVDLITAWVDSVRPPAVLSQPLGQPRLVLSGRNGQRGLMPTGFERVPGLFITTVRP